MPPRNGYTTHRIKGCNYKFNESINDLPEHELAKTTSLHGVLVDVYGVGVLITGDSGIGKSETALELVKRGHRLS